MFCLQQIPLPCLNSRQQPATAQIYKQTQAARNNLQKIILLFALFSFAWRPTLELLSIAKIPKKNNRTVCFLIPETIIQAKIKAILHN